ncbi:hypothetical protein [Albidovulum sp.]|uniref:hypothetical protein n=1 Tax=Albidovulum sp. TaxID=1872424 RepID=UPI001DBBEC6C|nr:hypothetical protein [Paracoccaceae bacterium]
MLSDFVVAIVAGLGAASVVYALRHLAGRLTGRQLPKWLLPVTAGLAMIAATIWSEYSWYPRTLAALGPDVVVADAVTERVAYRPWTFIFPMVTRFSAVDLGHRVAAGADGQIFAANAVLYQRWQPVLAVPQAFDCTQHARADLLNGATLGPDGSLNGTSWSRTAGDTLVAAACGGG